MKKTHQLPPQVLAAMPEKTIESVEHYVRNIVANQAIEGYICTPEEIIKLTEKVRRDHAEDIERFGGIVHLTLRGLQLRDGLPPEARLPPPTSTKAE